MEFFKSLEYRGVVKSGILNRLFVLAPPEDKEDDECKVRLELVDDES